EPEAVIDPAASPDRVLLEDPESGRGLARAGDARFRALDRRHERGRERGDAAQPVEEIERGALAGEQRAGEAVDPGDRAADRDSVAVGYDAREPDLGVEHPERGLGEIEAGHDALFARHDLRLAARVCGNDGV